MPDWRLPGFPGAVALVAVFFLAYLAAGVLGLDGDEAVNQTVALIVIAAFIIAVANEQEHWAKSVMFTWVKLVVGAVLTGLSAAPLIDTTWQGTVAAIALGVGITAVRVIPVKPRGSQSP